MTVGRQRRVNVEIPHDLKRNAICERSVLVSAFGEQIQPTLQQLPTQRDNLHPWTCPQAFQQSQKIRTITGLGTGIAQFQEDEFGSDDATIDL